MDGKKSQGQSSGKRRWVRLAFWPIVILAIWFVVMKFLDIPISHFFTSHDLPDFVDSTAKFLDYYNDAFPLILLTISAAISVGVNRWRMIGRLILGLAIAGGLVGLGKMLISRQRPRWFSGSEWQDTFTGFFPSWSDMKSQSFPSGDTAIAFVVSFILAEYFPRHRYLLYFLAMGCALSRVVRGYHYPSDIILGAAVGYLAARIVQYLSSPAGGK
jgi:undecaprenyl-diphosphatase